MLKATSLMPRVYVPHSKSHPFMPRATSLMPEATCLMLKATRLMLKVTWLLPRFTRIVGKRKLIW